MVIDFHPETSNYTIDLPNNPDMYNTFHASQLKHHVANNDALFPSRRMEAPLPVVTSDGLEEHLIDQIIDLRARGRGH